MLKLLKYSKYLLIWHPIQNLKHWFSFKQMDFTLDDKWRPFIIVEVIWIYILLVCNLIHLKINKIRCILIFLYKQNTIDGHSYILTTLFKQEPYWPVWIEGEGERVEESRVELTKNKLILC